MPVGGSLRGYHYSTISCKTVKGPCLACGLVIPGNNLVGNNASCVIRKLSAGPRLSNKRSPTRPTTSNAGDTFDREMSVYAVT
ncbi:hypothetical protein BaRGS_00006033 [Batillaria attramentaria]|uniref:Uncharacterized protein n=1 Tax=Batillaria attramentaria TaxID=370345 RepID=A0ABD0LUA9_9CAEN